MIQKGKTVIKSKISPSLFLILYTMLSLLFSSAGNVVTFISITKFVDIFVGGAGALESAATPNAKAVVAVTAFAGIAIAAAVFYTSRGHIKYPWSRTRRKYPLSPQQWRMLFTPEGKFDDGGVRFLKKVRSGGVDPSIRVEVWPFLLGVYDLNSSKEERDNFRTKRRKEYDKLRRQCTQLLKCDNESSKAKKTDITDKSADDGKFIQGQDSSDSGDDVNGREPLPSKELRASAEIADDLPNALLPRDAGSKGVADPNTSDSESSDCDSSAELSQTFTSTEITYEKDSGDPFDEDSSSKTEVQSKLQKTEDFATWLRIIRLDALRANDEWIPYSPTQAAVSEERARLTAEAVGLKDYDHLETCRIFHAARLVAILEAYALYDPKIGYCQGMSDLLSPIITVITEDHEAFWCFVGFMKKARHNFRLDEVGIRGQLNRVSKIIKCKDSHLFKHLEKLQAEDCFFVYRMVVVLFRRELTFEQTICLWEVMWADQAAIRAGIGKSSWSRIRQQAPPTDDLLLYAIAASVLQRRKLIIEKYSSMDEIIRECNSMAGHLDVWKLLDDAHELVVNLHDKVELLSDN